MASGDAKVPVEGEIVSETVTAEKEKTFATASSGTDSDSSVNIKWNVICGVVEIPGEKTVTLMYEVPDPIKQITWEWLDHQGEDGTDEHVAQMIARTSKCGSKSKPVPDPIFKKLGRPKLSRKDKYLKVQMSRKDNVSIEQYF